MTAHVLVLVALGTALGACSAAEQSSSPQINQVEWYPRDIVTPYDRLLVRANVTSQVGISTVKIFFKTSMSPVGFVSISDYETKDMWPGSGSMYNREWEFRFENQSAGTTIYFFIAAFDLNGANYTWHTYLDPVGISVKEAGPSFIGYVILYLNDISLNNQFCGANVTAHMQGYFPGIPEFGYIDVRISSIRGQIGGLTIFERGPRFYYDGEASVIAPLECDLENIPYDQYDLELALIIPRSVEKSEFDQQIPLYSRTFPGWDIWQINAKPQSVGRIGNETVVRVQYTLARQVPLLYSPLLLLLAAFAVVGLTPLVSLYHEPHSFELFLATIALVATAVLSEKLNPFGGLQTGVFEALFGIVLLSTVALMIISVVSPIVQKVQSHRLIAEVAATSIIAILIIYRVLTTNLPGWAKLLSPFALVLGSFVSVLIFLRRSGESTDTAVQASEEQDVGITSIAQQEKNTKTKGHGRRALSWYFDNSWPGVIVLIPSLILLWDFTSHRIGVFEALKDRAWLGSFFMWVGLAVGTACVLRALVRPYEPPEEQRASELSEVDKANRRNQAAADGTLTALLEEYAACHMNRDHYDSVRWSIGTIFLFASITLLGASFLPPLSDWKPVTLAAILSLGLFGVWLAYHLHVEPYVKISIERFREIERRLANFGYDVHLHSMISKRTREGRGVWILQFLGAMLIFAWVLRFALLS